MERGWTRRTAKYPAVVLGPTAAERLGVAAPGPKQRVWLGRGVVHRGRHPGRTPLTPELDTALLVGWPATQSVPGFDGYPTTVYARSAEAYVEDVRTVLAATANPQAPNEVEVSRPSEALAAKQATDETLNALCSASARWRCSSARPARCCQRTRDYANRRHFIVYRNVPGAPG